MPNSAPLSARILAHFATVPLTDAERLVVTIREILTARKQANAKAHGRDIPMPTPTATAKPATTANNHEPKRKPGRPFGSPNKSHHKRPPVDATTAPQQIPLPPIPDDEPLGEPVEA